MDDEGRGGYLLSTTDRIEEVHVMSLIAGVPRQPRDL